MSVCQYSLKSTKGGFIIFSTNYTTPIRNDCVLTRVWVFATQWLNGFEQILLQICTGLAQSLIF